ncbi:MAG TPA: hypothetical protein VF914_20290 [Chloroflexia bacterium]
MADPTLRPPGKALRAAGLLPQNHPEHHVAPGDSVPPQVPPVSQIFGPARLRGDRTLIDVTSVRYLSGPLARYLLRRESKMARRPGLAWIGKGGDYALRKRVAVVEVSDLGVRVRLARRRQLILVCMAAVGWNVYWVLRTLREWRERPE